MEIQDVQLRKKFERKKNLTLLACILFDGVGMLSYAFPGVGETIDIAWAPIAGTLYFALFGGIPGVLGGLFTFLEELLPVTDLIPSFTITWLFMYVVWGSKQFTQYKNKFLPKEAPHAANS